MALNTFADVKAFLNKVMADNGETGGLSNSPHKDFWNSLTYQQFTTGNVPGVNDPNTNKPIPILVKGSSATVILFCRFRVRGHCLIPIRAISVKCPQMARLCSLRPKSRSWLVGSMLAVPNDDNLKYTLIAG